MYDKDLNKVRRNIHVSRAISKLKGTSYEYLQFLEIFSYKYNSDIVKAALRDLYNYNCEIKDIKGLTAALIRKNYNLQ